MYVNFTNFVRWKSFSLLFFINQEVHNNDHKENREKNFRVIIFGITKGYISADIAKGFFCSAMGYIHAQMEGGEARMQLNRESVLKLLPCGRAASRRGKRILVLNRSSLNFSPLIKTS